MQLPFKSARHRWYRSRGERPAVLCAAPLAWIRLTLVLLTLFLSLAGLASSFPEPGSHKRELVVDGHTRTYIVHVPKGASRTGPLPLVLMLHGGGGTARATMWETKWPDKADREGFVVVFPNALARNPDRRSSFARNPQLWNDGSDRFYEDQQAVDDVAFIAALLDELSARLPIDPGRIYLTGFSNGASMSFLAGARLSDRIAAIAPVAGALWFDPAPLARPVSLCYITGTADPLNLMEGGAPKLASGGSDEVRAKPKPPVRESIARWAGALDCPSTATRVEDDNGLRTERFSTCRGGAEVVYYAVDELGHTWAGGRSILPEWMVGKTSDRISATDVIWTFFQQHPKISVPADASTTQNKVH